MSRMVLSILDVLVELVMFVVIDNVFVLVFKNSKL